jgi:hypothetical protein
MNTCKYSSLRLRQRYIILIRICVYIYACATADISTDTSDISTVSTDTADEGLDSPGVSPASGELVATPHGTPGTPTVNAKTTRAAREGQEWGGDVGREQRGARRGERRRDCGASR